MGGIIRPFFPERKLFGHAENVRVSFAVTHVIPVNLYVIAEFKITAPQNRESYLDDRPAFYGIEYHARSERDLFFLFSGQGKRDTQNQRGGTYPQETENADRIFPETYVFFSLIYGKNICRSVQWEAPEA